MTDVNQFSSVEPLIRGYPSWVGELDATRIAAYQQYEAMYWNIQNAFELIQRGTDEMPIYIPTGMQVVETYHRYLAKGFEVIADPDHGSEAQRAESLQLFREFARRERFYGKFSSAKRFGIIRGDWLFHLYADPELPEGSRISIFPVDPASFFPIYNPENIDEIIGCHLIDFISDEDDEYIRRVTYMKDSGRGGPSTIVASDQIFEIDEWGGPGVEQGNPVSPSGIEHEAFTDRPLPEPIDALPVYHIQNFQEPGTPWGSSELRGMERLCAAINQSISDEELTLALEGLGVYATNAGSPVNENGEPVPWNLGPGRVVELPTEGTLDFKRVNGASSMKPFQDHLKYLHSQIDGAKGLSDIVKGTVEVQSAESGIALRLQMEPLLSRVGEGEQIVTDVTTNMLYDLRKWFVAYEGLGGLMEIQWLPRYGEKIPVNREQRFKEIMSMVENKIIDPKTAREELVRLGYSFPEDIEDRVQKHQQREIDLIGSRIDAELGDG